MRLGAIATEGGTQFTVFTDRASRIAVRLLDRDGRATASVGLNPAGEGLHTVFVPEVRPGTLYDYLLDDERVPDAYARFLPQGVHGPAEVVATEFPWKHGLGVNRPLNEQIIYELHVGTFTPEGTYEAALARLPELCELGVTTLELMPLAAFAGRRGWGYDGVALFAPFAPYGSPAELKRFIDEAHGHGLAVVLDAVYNHFGPAGNYLGAYSRAYFKAEPSNPWGNEPDFAGRPMRQLVLENVHYWLGDFRFDGLRLDATHTIHDSSSPHILEELAALAHELPPGKLCIAEDERNEVALVTRLGLDALWADDFHHVVHVTATGERDGYYASYLPGAEALAATLSQGWLYQGQTYPTTGLPRGSLARDLAAHAFVYALQNHDQIGNRALGERLIHLAGPEVAAGLAALLLFLPMTPLLFMGEEWGASSPFLYFTDHEPELGRLVTQGRRAEFSAFRAFAGESSTALVPDPQEEETFLRSRLRWEERASEPHARLLSLYTRLIGLRKSDPVLRASPREGFSAQAREGVLVCRRALGNEDRLLVLNMDQAPLSAAALSDILGGRRSFIRTDHQAPEAPLPFLAAVLAG